MEKTGKERREWGEEREKETDVGAGNEPTKTL